LDVIVLILFLVAMLMAGVLTPSIRGWATRWGWVSWPLGHHTHTEPLPRIGGVAVFLSFLVTTQTYIWALRWMHLRPGFETGTYFAILEPAALIFILGVVDDVRPLNAPIKFAVQVVAAALLHYNGVRLLQVSFFGGHLFGTIASLVATIFWVLLITNAFNLLDGLDGLAAGSAMFSTIVVLVVASTTGNALIVALTAVMAGALLGFLPYNFNPATIFLGDSGSLFIGFMLAAVSVAASQKTPTLLAVAIPVVSFGLPILDTLLALTRRLVRGQPLFSGDREHIHHRLLKLGFSHRGVVALLYGVSAALGLLSLLLLHPSDSGVAVVLGVVGVGVWVGVQRLGYHELGEIGRIARRTMDQREIITNNLAIRHAMDELQKCSTYDEIRQALARNFEHNAFVVVRLCAERMEGEPERETIQFECRNPKRVGEAITCTLVFEGWSSGRTLHGRFELALSGNQVMVDINLLTASPFTQILLDAIERTTSPRVHVVHARH
jgi:UDP-GlcNAc:undecaprenyl-phosphate GlcNAc-1-phosphate transferase